MHRTHSTGRLNLDSPLGISPYKSNRTTVGAFTKPKPNLPPPPGIFTGRGK